MDLIYTNPSREDVGVLHNYELDLAFGSDENNLECVVSRNDHCCEFGSYLYIEGTEYGGIIDGIESKNSTNEVVYSGRTWHGILNSKVLQPDDGQDYLVLSGEANAVIASLLTRMGLSDLFEASSEDSGLTIRNYKMNRYIGGYEGIMKMLKTVDAKLLLCVQSSGKVLLSAVPVVDYTKEELDSDLIDLDVKRTANTVNHLICLGQGNLAERTVVHLYADENGNISQTQTFKGVDEYVAVFDYSNAESEDDLLKSGIDRLKELMQQDDLSVDVNDVDDPYDVGDLVGASDNITNIKITVPVTKKIVTIKNGMVTIDIKTETGNLSESKNEGSSGGGGGSGEPGEPGQPGKDGKSAYESAKEGGYTGTEAQFNTDLAQVSNKETAGTAASAVSSHNTDTSAHADIRSEAKRYVDNNAVKKQYQHSPGYLATSGWYRVGEIENSQLWINFTSVSRLIIGGSYSNHRPNPFVVDIYRAPSDIGLRQLPAMGDPSQVDKVRVCMTASGKFGVDIHYKPNAENFVSIDVETVQNDFTFVAFANVTDSTETVLASIDLTKDGFLGDRPTTDEMNAAASNAQTKASQYAELVATNHNKDASAHADIRDAMLPKSGGTMTGPIVAKGIKTRYPQYTYDGCFVHTNPNPWFNYGGSGVGIVVVNLGKGLSFMAADITMASQSMSANLCLSGYAESGSGFGWTSATGVINGVSPRVRCAGDAEGNKYFLLGDVNTNWGSYCHVVVTNLLQFAPNIANDTVQISMTTDESIFVSVKEVSFKNVAPVDPSNLSAPVPIEKGGTGATTAADARTSLGITPANIGAVTTNLCYPSDMTDLVEWCERQPVGCQFGVTSDVTGTPKRSYFIGTLLKGCDDFRAIHLYELGGGASYEKVRSLSGGSWGWGEWKQIVTTDLMNTAINQAITGGSAMTVEQVRAICT